MKNMKLITIVGWTLIAIATVCNTVAGMLAYNRMFEEFYNRIAQKTEDERIRIGGAFGLCGLTLFPIAYTVCNIAGRIEGTVIGKLCNKLAK